ncbi:MAG: UDP-N-acetylglucosamine 1-carboxyvinyltransferase [Coprobacillus sp.]|nr:UDP-N-acetylglucosamine 1-carboxyvinyltransferase [Coprobacillus sp.]
MEKYVIKGGVALKGEVEISGAKNAALALIAAAIMADENVTIENLPDVSDINQLIDAIETIGATINRVDRHTVIINGATITSHIVEEEQMRKIRASYYLLGALLGKFHKAEVALPGGCVIGARPIDQHLKGFSALGAEVIQDHGMLNAFSEQLKGNHIFFDVSSVGATINVMLAAVKAEGRTVIENAAKEPEIIDVVNLLTKMGAKIRGAGTDTITIEGVEHLKGCTHEIIPDRIEAGTFLIMAAAAGERVIIQNIIPQHLESLISKLKEVGVKMENVGDSIIVYGDNKNFNAVDVRTQVYPGFATDLQQPLTALLTQANGQSQVIETIYPERFRHCEQLNKMGANIELDEAMCYINGKTPLKGAKVEATDLRCGAALLIAGLIADGITEISNVYHIDRGYANIDQKLITLGAVIRRIKVDD